MTTDLLGVLAPQLPSAEIEITPAMLDAGERVLCRYDGSQERYWAEEVYLAMRRAALLPTKQET